MSYTTGDLTSVTRRITLADGTTATLEIDVEVLVDALARKARGSKQRKASALYGAVWLKLGPQHVHDWYAGVGEPAWKYCRTCPAHEPADKP